MASGCRHTSHSQTAAPSFGWASRILKVRATLRLFNTHPAAKGRLPAAARVIGLRKHTCPRRQPGLPSLRQEFTMKKTPLLAGCSLLMLVSANLHAWEPPAVRAREAMMAPRVVPVVPPHGEVYVAPRATTPYVGPGKDAYIAPHTGSATVNTVNGGTATRSYGSASATTANGGTASRSDGTASVTTANGGTASRGDGSATATTANGGTATRSYGSASATTANGGSASRSDGTATVTTASGKTRSRSR